MVSSLLPTRMPTGGRTTLAQFLIESRVDAVDHRGDLEALLADIALACKTIAVRVALGALGTASGYGRVDGGTEPDEAPEPLAHNVHGEAQQPLDLQSNDIFLGATEWGGHLAGMVSEEMAEPYEMPAQFPRGKYLLLFDPLDGSSNIDVNLTVGSIFSILRAPVPGQDATLVDFLQHGAAQVCAGYALYGPSTMLVLTLGRGTHAFTLNPEVGEWILTHPDVRIPESTREFAINASNARFWEPPVARYVEECLAGRTGPRGVDFNMRWIASLVAEAHRILMRGGVFMYPRDTKDPAKPGRLRLLYEINPVSMLIEQAGGMASTGHHRAMDVVPTTLHQRVGFVFGSRDEVARIEQYHREHDGQTTVA